MKRTLVAVFLPTAASLALAAPAFAAASTKGTTENWAGYEATPAAGKNFSSVSGGWTQPKVTCATSQPTYGAFWVGLGGDSNSQALEQEGTQADCSSTGKASYFAWYELVPAGPVKIPLAVRPGDKMWAKTSVSGDKVRVEIDNKTTHKSYAKTLTMTSTKPDTSSAEWIAEAPSECLNGAAGECRPLPLSDFGSLSFNSAQATSAGKTKPLSGWANEAITMDSASGRHFGYGGGYGGGFGGRVTRNLATTEATPGSLSKAGSAFTISYKGGANAGQARLTAEPEAAGGPNPGGGGYGYGYGPPPVYVPEGNGYVVRVY
ncbi:MAG: hypothetical protein J2O48_09625 [Solirubrobacterales bacterium]|nr:hypothetical protein [Solirubrobacterales bacterium]